MHIQDRITFSHHKAQSLQHVTTNAIDQGLCNAALGQNCGTMWPNLCTITKVIWIDLDDIIRAILNQKLFSTPIIGRCQFLMCFRKLHLFIST